MNKFKFFLSLILMALFVLPINVSASSLYFKTNKANYSPGDIFSVDVRLDVTDKCINTVEAEISFPKDLINIVDFNSGGSLLNLWVENPANREMAAINNDGKIYFSGGIPGGYCGKISGDPGDSNIIGKLIFSIPNNIPQEKLPQKLELTFVLDKTAVYLNDGQGTKDLISAPKYSINIIAATGSAINDWKNETANDTLPPESFVVELNKQPGMYNGQYFIIFSTTDKQTGVDHYEVLEMKPGGQVGIAPNQNLWQKLIGKKSAVPNWVEAKSPYLLKDQNLESIVSIKAVDKAGNERLVEYTPPLEKIVEIKRAQSNKLIYTVIALLIIVLLGLLFVVNLLKKRQNK